MPISNRVLRLWSILSLSQPQITNTPRKAPSHKPRMVQVGQPWRALCYTAMPLPGPADLYLTPYTTINSKQVRKLNVKHKTRKVDKKSRGKDSSHWSLPWFLRYDAKSTGNKTNKQRWTELHQSKEHNKENNLQNGKASFRMWVYICKPCMCGKGLIVKMYEEVLQQNYKTKINKKTLITLLKNRLKTWRDTFPKKTYYWQ